MVPTASSNSDQASVVYEWPQTKTVGFVTAFLLLLCFSKNSARFLLNTFVFYSQQSVSQYACGPPSEPVVCFAEPASEIRGRTNVCGGQGWIAPLGLKPLGLGVPEQSPTAWDSRTHLSYETTGKAEPMGFLSLLDSLHLPKKPYGNRHTRQKQPGPREFSPLWSLHWRKSKCSVEILCVR